MEPFHWQGSAQLFFAHSNEERRLHDHFVEHVLPRLREHTKSITSSTFRWLDVGPGDGLHLRSFKEVVQASLDASEVDLQLTLIEPSMSWFEQLLSLPGFNDSERVTAIPETFQEHLTRHSLSDYHLVTFTHLLYDRALADALTEAVAAYYSTALTRHTAIHLVMEQPGSAMDVMRSRLEALGVPVPRTQYQHLADALRDTGIPHEVIEIPDQWCTIDPVDLMTNDQHWLFGFVIGGSTRDLDQLSAGDQRSIREVVRDHISSLADGRLSIDDVTIWIPPHYVN